MAEPRQGHLPDQGEHAPQRTEQWGTHVMGAPGAPSSHPDNQKAASWDASSSGAVGGHQTGYNPQPYVQYSPAQSSPSPLDAMLHKFNSWSKQAETVANNIWQNLHTSSSPTDAAWGKVNLAAKAVTGGGFESLYKQTFQTYPNEHLKKTFACYLSTTSGPVAGTLYLSDFHVAFCSDRPLTFVAPSGQNSWAYYKVMIPLNKIVAMNPVVMKDNPSEKYIQISTIDSHDFWFMGFVNFDKASSNLTASISSHATPGLAAPAAG